MFDEQNSSPLDSSDSSSAVSAPRGDAIENPPYKGPDTIKNPPYKGPDAIENPPSSEPFIPSRSDRPYHQWGKPDFSLQGAFGYPGIAPGPLMPQIRDLAGLIHGAVMGLGRFGSHYTGMPAIAMGTYANAYWTAYQKGMKERASDAYQQYRMARQMTIDRGKEEMEEYAKIYGAYHDDKGNITDPNAFSHELLTAAHKYQNAQLIAAIQSGNLPMADRILGATDSHISNLIKAAHQEERQRQADQERQERLRIERGRYDLEQRREAERERANAEKRKALEDARKAIDPNATGPGPNYVPDIGPGRPGDAPGSVIPPEPDEPGSTPPSESGERDVPSDDDTAPADTDPNDAAPSGASDEPPQDEIAAKTRGMVADASGTPAPNADPSKAVGFGPEGKEETPVLENAAKGWVFSHKIPDYIDKRTMPDFAARIAKRGQDLENYLSKLASDPKVTGDQMKKELHRLFPGFADNVEKAISGDLQPPRNIGPSNQQFWNLLSSVGNKIDPNFTSDTFAARAKARIFWTTGPGGVKLTTIGTAFHHLNELRDLVLQDKKPMQLNPFSEWWAQHVGDYSEFPTTLNRAMHEMENALASSGTGGGSATIPEMKAARADMTTNQSNNNFLKRVDDNIKLLTERLGELYSQYETTTGRKSEEVRSRFQEYAKKAAPAYKDLDPTFSDNLFNAPDRLKALMEYKSGSLDSGKKRHTPEEISGAKKWLADPKNASDPRRSKIEQILGGQ